MEAVVINLPQDRRRREFMQRQLAGGPFQFRFLDATDFKTVDITWIENNLAPTFRMKLQSVRCVTYGSVACAESHRRAWFDIVQSPSGGPFLLLEDDCYFPRGSLAVIGQLAPKLPTIGYDLVILYYSVLKEVQLPRGRSILISEPHRLYPYPEVPTAGSVAYLVTKRGAEILANLEAIGLTRMADDWRAVKGHIRIGIVYPLLVQTGFFVSSIWDGNWRQFVVANIGKACLKVPLVRDVLLAKKAERINQMFVIS